MISSILFIKSEQHVCKFPGINIGPPGRDRSVSPFHGKCDGLNLIDVLNSTLENLSGCRAIQAFDLGQCYFPAIESFDWSSVSEISSAYIAEFAQLLVLAISSKR